MKSVNQPIFVFVALAVTAEVLVHVAPGLSQEKPTSGTQVATSSEIVTRSKQNYLLYLPKNYAPDDKHPLVLFLHGAGERGDGKLERVKVHGPPKLIADGKEFPFIVVSPQCKEGGWWDAAELSGLLDHIEANYKVDKDRIYVTGLSMGGFGTWALALREPNRFAAIAPICGGGNSIAARYTKRLTAAVWAFHGDKDAVVPLSESEEMVDALKKNKVDVKLTVYPGVNHNSWTQTYDNDELYTWLLKHRRQEDEAR